MNVIYLIMSFIEHFVTAFRIKLFQKRFRAIKLFGIKPILVKSESILVVVTHVVPNAKQLSEAEKAEKLERFRLTIDGLLDSLSSYKITLVVNTLENMHLVDWLPSYQKDKIMLNFAKQNDPMMVEFCVYDIFKENAAKHDYYMFIEDDIILSDTWFVEKIKLFNGLSLDNRFVLLPHRYEMIEGNKFIIDQEIFYGEKMEIYTVNSLFEIKIGEIVFQEFENAHAAMYMLNAGQLAIWLKSGNKWNNNVVAFGQLESAATYSLYENFKFLKPSLGSIDFLQVKHFGTKYSSRFYKK